MSTLFFQPGHDWLLIAYFLFHCQVFRSQDYSSVLYCLKQVIFLLELMSWSFVSVYLQFVNIQMVLQLFEKVEVDKPAASRSASAEIYVLGLRYKAPAKIDPRLLDVKHLFQGSVEPQRKVIVTASK